MEMQEKIYYSSDDNESDVLNDFFNELVKRKKDDVDDWGLQASMVIRDNDYAAQINEKDGAESHNLTLINLYNNLNGDNNNYFSKDLSDDNKKQLNLDTIKMNLECIKVRIISSMDRLQIICTGNTKDQKTSLYQNDILR